MCYTTNAQTIPEKQENGINIPENLKIDGKSAEWGEQLQSYNKSTEIYYTVANDHNNLCFVIKAKKPLIIKKIISQGITISINYLGKNDFKSAIAITYPLLHNKTGTITMKLNDKSFSSINDSVLSSMNNQLKQNAKEIVFINAQHTADTLSVYNDLGLKAASLFDNQKVYTYELLVPVKLLNLPDDKTISFSYNIKLNGVEVNGTLARMSTDGKAVIFGDKSKDVTVVEMVLPPDVMASYFPTDFWAKYTGK